jgi:hypothetical protein
LVAVYRHEPLKNASLGPRLQANGHADLTVDVDEPLMLPSKTRFPA